jgi:hypothetical protein
VTESSYQDLDADLVAHLPNFFVIGAAKAGTTTLYELLGRHPQIYLPRIKEPHFFSNEAVHSKGLEWYARTHYAAAEVAPARGDATPHYLYYEKAATRIARELPPSHHRFIVVLRNPVDRAYSLYWNMVHEGHETEPFERAIQLESERDFSELETMGTVRQQYLASGLYGAQLAAWFRVFDPECFLVILNEDLSRDTDRVLSEVFEFLGVPALAAPERVERSNRASQPRSVSLQRFLRRPSRVRHWLGRLLPFHLKRRIVTGILERNRRPFEYPPMSPSTRAQLSSYFRSDLELLESLIGRSLQGWLEDPEPIEAGAAPHSEATSER